MTIHIATLEKQLPINETNYGKLRIYLQMRGLYYICSQVPTRTQQALGSPSLPLPFPCRSCKHFDLFL